MGRSFQCGICGGDSYTFLFNSVDYLYENVGVWELGRCNSCKVVQILFPPSEEELSSFYPSSYYAYNSTLSKSKYFLKKLFFPTLLVREVSFKSPGRVLDYGCGNGSSLFRLKSLGWECCGVEPSKDAVKFGNENYGVNISLGTSSALSTFSNKSFDYIRANHSLEHDFNAATTFSQFRRLIKEDGKLLIGVPNINSINFKIFGKYWWYICAPVHIFHYSPSTLEALAKKNGFKISSIRYTGNFTGLLGSISIYLSRNDQHPNVFKSKSFRFLPFIALAQLASLFLNLLNIGDAMEIVFEPI